MGLISILFGAATLAIIVGPAAAWMSVVTADHRFRFSAITVSALALAAIASAVVVFVIVVVYSLRRMWC